MQNPHRMDHALRIQMSQFKLYCHRDTLNLSYEMKQRVHHKLKSRRMEAFWCNRGGPWRNHRDGAALSVGDDRYGDYQCRSRDVYQQEHDQPQDSGHQNSMASLDACSHIYVT